MKELDAIIVVSDVAPFTKWLPITTEQMMEVKRRYIQLTKRLVTESGGEVVSFYGDSATCLWDISTESKRQAEIGAGLVKWFREVSEFEMGHGMHMTTHLAVTAGHLIRTEDDFGGVRQGLPVFGADLNFAMRLNAACRHFKRNFLVSDRVEIICPREVVLQKVEDITIKGYADTRVIYAVEQAANPLSHART